MPTRQSDLVEIRRTKGKGRGVFARVFIAAGTLFERVPVLVVPESATLGTMLSDYAFEWTRGKVALALGYGSLYNHSYQPNARYEDLAGQTKGFFALRDIDAGEEITVSYNGDPEDLSPMEFDVL